MRGCWDADGVREGGKEWEEWRLGSGVGRGGVGLALLDWRGGMGNGKWGVGV